MCSNTLYKRWACLAASFVTPVGQEIKDVFQISSQEKHLHFQERSQEKSRNTPFVNAVHCASLGVNLVDQDSAWGLRIVYHNRVSSLRHLSIVKRKSLTFGVPIVWRKRNGQSFGQTNRTRPHEAICKNLNKEGGCFEYIKEKFPNFSAEKVKEGVSSSIKVSLQYLRF